MDLFLEFDLLKVLLYAVTISQQESSKFYWRNVVTLQRLLRLLKYSSIEIVTHDIQDLHVILGSAQKINLPWPPNCTSRSSAPKSLAFLSESSHLLSLARSSFTYTFFKLRTSYHAFLESKRLKIRVLPPRHSQTMKEESSRDTPEGSAAGDESKASLAAKDRKCQYCQQAFTSSSLGRHLDQFLFKKKPDGIHDVEEIRRIRSGITRRQARTSTGKNEGSPERSEKKGHSDSYTTAEPSSKSREAPVRMMFNTPTWHATGVINDIPNPSRAPDGPRTTPSQSRTTSLQLPDYASRGASASNPDTMRALELALREVLDNIKAATYVELPPLLILTLAHGLLALGYGLGCLHSISTSKLRPFPLCACSCYLPLRAYLRRILSLPRAPFHSKRLALNT
jgi:hypothetical protein